MKVLTLLICASALILGLIALRAPEPQAAPVEEVTDGAVPYELQGEVPADRVVRSFEVEGMCCAGCAKKLHGAVSALDGVGEVAVDSVKGMAFVVVPPDFEVAELREALTFDKYVATSL